MWRLLSQPYPVEVSPLRGWIRAAWIGAFVGLFLLLFQPFGLYLWETPHKTWKILGFGLITLVTTGLMYTLPPLLLKGQFVNERWTVGREITWIVTNILFIGIANWLYLNALTGELVTTYSFLWMVLITFVIGVFPTTASVMISYLVRLRRYSQAAAALPVHSHPAAPSEPTSAATAAALTFLAENEKDTFEVRPGDLLFIESSDNYSTFHYLKNGQPAKTLLRSSLSRLEGQLTSQPSLVRCHRSYIVNLLNVEKVTGNAQGYKLHLHDGAYQVPVARKYNDSLVSELKRLG